jgi:hypothetical protein
VRIETHSGWDRGVEQYKAERFFVLELIEKVTVVPAFVAIPDVGEALSQLGKLLIEYTTGPLGAASLYMNFDAENGPP